jgi:hypothetical protein
MDIYELKQVVHLSFVGFLGTQVETDLYHISWGLPKVILALSHSYTGLVVVVVEEVVVVVELLVVVVLEVVVEEVELEGVHNPLSHLTTGRVVHLYQAGQAF